MENFKLKKKVAFFSKMYQAIPHLAQVQSLTGGTFVCNRSNTFSLFTQMYPKLNATRYNKLIPWSKGKQRLKNSDLIITGSPYEKFLKPYSGKKLMVFHGTYMMLSRDAAEQNAFFDHLFLTGPRMKQMLCRFQNEFNFNFSETGFLPFAEFPDFNPEKTKDFLKAEGLDPHKKTILFCPSRKKIGTWKLIVEKLIDELGHSYNLILRPHPSQAMNPKKDDKILMNKLMLISKSNDNNIIVGLMKYKLSKLMSITDLIISDANSPAEESLFYDLPQLFVEGPNWNRDIVVLRSKEQGLHEEDTNGLLKLFECGPSFYRDKFKSWKDAVDEAIGNADKFKQARNDYFHWVFGERDKQAGERVAKVLKEKFDT